ncbi:hydantoinase/oxoprolinase family protein [Epidermidibacterium keratini]|uniref:Hydantoinase/oxoprolinase family protein n=1 Tax=Epidermidibacterium keratini TaxID=1891644 RepID=A0A7L4YSH6_9ACTN|nr:hydantoinase/oxoprolinase family protein [Epidermidibacterium keratini]
MRIGVDIGGTFTDLCVIGPDGILAVGKTLTTPDEPARAVEEVIAQTLERIDIPARDITGFVHGTTLVTNALIERRGSATALLATQGFRDVLEMAREHRYELHDLMVELPKPLVPRHLRFGVTERTLAGGQIEQPLDTDEVRSLARELTEHGIEAIAIAFLHSFSNDANEQAAREVIEQEAPGIRIALSSKVAPEIREYERTSTTVANVYVQDITERYLADLGERSARLGIPREPHIMLSNGGLATLQTAARFPIRMLESGPAGGALAAAWYGARAGWDDVLAFDMGGTTAKLCMVEGGVPLVNHEFEVDRVYRLSPGSGLPVKVPVIDMIEIGVGGGSIARIDALGLLSVGPRSAGSKPGPACYGLGGTEPTVTDADLVLGYLDPDYFLGGQMALDVSAARTAIEAKIATPLGISVEEAAWGIHSMVNGDMANAARVHAVERGKDPAGLPLFTFGGAGPVHGVGVATALGAAQMIAPPAAGVMSAVGFLTAPVAFDFARSARARLDDVDVAEFQRMFAQMEAEGRDLLTESGVEGSDIEHTRSADLRFEGQGFEVRVPVPDDVTDRWPQSLLEAHHAAYTQLYGAQIPDVPVEVITWRVVSSGPQPEVNLALDDSSSDPTTEPRAHRDVYLPESGFARTPVYERYALPIGANVEGPAIIEERESTIVVTPGATAAVADDYSVVVDLTKEPAHG